MKYLIINGCSWTAYAYGVHEEYKKGTYNTWARHLAKKLNMKLINLAQGGSGNQGIYNRTFDVLNYIDPKDIGLVFHMWTDCHRRDFEAYDCGPHHINHEYVDDLPEEMKWSGYKDMSHNAPPGNFIDWIHASLRYYYMFQELCESRNIPYAHIQGVNFFWNFYNQIEHHKFSFETNHEKNPRDNMVLGTRFTECFGTSKQKYGIDRTIPYYRWPRPDKQELIGYFKNNMYYDKIKNFINWPIDEPNENIDWTKDNVQTQDPEYVQVWYENMEKYGFSNPGYEIENNIQQRFGRYNTRHETWVNSSEDLKLQDWHPNNKTHVKIADYIYDCLKGQI